MLNGWFMNKDISRLMGFIAGFADTTGFVALHGLFLAHVTGNFVTLGASVAQNTSGALGKLIALPVFCLTLLAMRFLGNAYERNGKNALVLLFAIEALLLTLGAYIAIYHGPFEQAGDPQLLGVGMLWVMAMATQNGIHRLYMKACPPTTVVTGTTTQLMLDFADLLMGNPANIQADKGKIITQLSSVISFALGCGAAAVAYSIVNVWCFIVPPVLFVITLTLLRRDMLKLLDKEGMYE